MKFEFKTENENYLKSIPQFLAIAIIFTLIIILSDYALKLGVISRYYQVNYNCRLLSLEKSSTNFKKLSKLSNLKSKQRIWELCRQVIN